MRHLTLLGASGSIGSQTLDILRQFPDRFSLVAFSVGRQVDKIAPILRDFPSVKGVYCIDGEEAEKLQKSFPDIRFYFGDNGLISLLREIDSDMVVNALVGFAGVEPTLVSLSLNRILCLANKESLVVAGGLVNKSLSQGHGRLYPIDSEHVAIAKLLSCIDRKDLDTVFITASGGPFWRSSREEMAFVTPKQALHHPTWSMGRKITIDSATMMNKGFEVVEACYLFNLSPKQITILIQPESYVHSLIKTKGGLYLADVSAPDMHGPIQYALFEGQLSFAPRKGNSLADFAPYSFFPFDPKRFPSVEIATSCFEEGGNRGAVLNGANEEAVYAFLDGKLPLLKIEEAVRYALRAVPRREGSSYSSLKEDDAASRRAVRAYVEAALN